MADIIIIHIIQKAVNILDLNKKESSLYEKYNTK
jgi:hypothetical protein